MRITSEIANQLRQVHRGGNWTAVNLKDTLEAVRWQEATQSIENGHSIAGLVFHMNYFVAAVLGVLRNGVLDASDKLSFDCPPIVSEEQWQALILKTLSDADELAGMIEGLPEAKLSETFADEKYGSYLRNLQGVIEHCHYHLGQITMIRKLARSLD